MRRLIIAAAVGLSFLSAAGLSAPASARGLATPVHDTSGWQPHQHARPHFVPPRAFWAPPRPHWHRPAPHAHYGHRDYQRDGWQRFGWR